MPSYSFEKVYHLIQQTPLIHFQHDQAGATLRATEVKPKLDRFLTELARSEKADVGKWRMSDRHDALDYKMSITADGGEWRTEPVGEKRSYEIFYGNMGRTDKLRAVVCDAELKIICFNQDLREYIDKNIAKFFIATNFGMMQSKGFGSFVIREKPFTQKDISKTLRDVYGAQKCYNFPGGDSQTAFARIKTVYALMKSGINLKIKLPDGRVLPPMYQRSALFEFMHEAYGIGNEKAWMKQQRIAPTIGRQHEQHDDVSYYVRALLGIGDHIDFIRELGNPKDKMTVKIKNCDGDIARFPSPILFKVIGRDVYYVGRRINKKIYGTTFEFSSPMGSGVIQVPTVEVLGEDFVDRFLADCMERLNHAGLAKFRDTKNIHIQEV